MSSHHQPPRGVAPWIRSATVCNDDQHYMTTPTTCECGYFPNVVKINEAKSSDALLGTDVSET